MKFYWRKLGKIYSPSASSRHAKLLTHASNPLPVRLGDSLYRVFYSGRDSQNRSSVGAFDFDIERRLIVKDYFEPFFVHGPEDSFYSDGVSIGNCYLADGQRYMLFMGWQNPNKQHWRGDIGRLKVTPDYKLELEDTEPFMGVDSVDEVSLSYPWVQWHPSHNYTMWYGSTLTWDAGNGEMVHVINHAHSNDGHEWQRKGIAIPFELGTAQAFSRPTVLEANSDALQMWFSYRSGRGEKYRIGYAESERESGWRLALDSAGIDVSVTGWDSEMVCYPFALRHKGDSYLFYNGNSHGKTGIGLAKMELL